MNTNTFLHGFGDVAVQSTAVAKPNAWDKIGNILTNVVKPAADIYTQVKTNQPSSNNQPVQQATTAPWNTGSAASNTPAAADSNTKKYLLIGGIGLLAVGGIYFATKKKGKK